MAAFRNRKRRRFLDDLDSEASSTTVLEAGAIFAGDVVSPGDAVVAGVLEGTLEAAGRVRVAPAGRVRGPVRAAEAKIEGTVEGPVEVSGRLEIGAEARIEGSIAAERLDVADGARLLGEVSTSSPKRGFVERRGEGTGAS